MESFRPTAPTRLLKAVAEEVVEASGWQRARSPGPEPSPRTEAMPIRFSVGAAVGAASPFIIQRIYSRELFLPTAEMAPMRVEPERFIPKAPVRVIIC